MMNRMNYAAIENDHHHHYHDDHDDNLYWNAAALLPKVRRDPEQESPWPAFQPRSSGNQKVHADHQYLICFVDYYNTLSPHTMMQTSYLCLYLERFLQIHSS